MILHSVNFGRALTENKYLLVEFYAPWCGHCKQLEPVYAAAAEKLKKEESAMRLAKVDATVERELAEEFDVGGFPTLKLFINGDRKQPVDFTGKRSTDGIIQWMKRRAGPGAPVLDTVGSAAQFIDAHNISVVGFFKDLESDASKAFSDISYDMTDVEFAKTMTAEVFQKYEVKGDSVVLFKKFDDGRADFPLSEEGKLDKGNVTTFIKFNSLELIVKFSQETAEKIFTSGITLHSLLFINSTVQTQTDLVEQTRPVAKDFKGKMLFIVIDVMDPVTHVLNYFGVSADEVPTVRLINMGTEKKFGIPAGDLTVESLRQLCKDVVDGSAKPYYRSQEIPENWNEGPVKVLVGKNFESVALDQTKNVFVEFYAPWCGHCKELAPIWKELGEKYADRQDIVIAMMDATANEVESVDVKGFPTLKYFPAGGKEVQSSYSSRGKYLVSQYRSDSILGTVGQRKNFHEFLTPPPPPAPFTYNGQISYVCSSKTIC
uniref:Protein disulfide-isomerase n=1 Tax=Sphaeramia orbicularis TaxID=375764 RepID=A0A673A5V0_9TELE